MFEDSFIESSRKGKSRRGVATLVSFVVQAIIIAVLVLIPLLVTQALPTPKVLTELVAPPPPPPPPPPPSAAKATPSQPVKTEVPVVHENQLTAPVKIPQKVAIVKEQPSSGAAAPSVAGVTGGVPGGVAGGQIGGVVGGVLGAVATPKLAAPQKVRVSQGVSEGLLVHKVMPQYPAQAKQQRVQGAVQLQATISKDGTIKDLRVLSGNPLLNNAATDAVKQWRYKPYFLNGQAVEVETTITVNFKLA